MSNLYYAAKYKNNIINLLLKNKMFIKLINPQAPKHPDLDVIDVLLGGEWILDGKKYEEQGYIFDYMFVNDTTSDVKTFTFVEVTNGTIDEYGLLSYSLYIYVFTDKTLVRLTDKTIPTVDELKNSGYFASTNANRVDTLCDCIDRTLNRNEYIKGIGDIEPAKNNYVQLYSPNQNYYGKVLCYRIKNLDIGGDDFEN